MNLVTNPEFRILLIDYVICKEEVNNYVCLNYSSANVDND